MANVSRRGLFALAGLGIMGMVASRFDGMQSAFAAGSLPDTIVNGSFDYPGLSACRAVTPVMHDPTYLDSYIDPNAGTVYFTTNANLTLNNPTTYPAESMWNRLPGFDDTRFRWRSTQEATSGDIYHVRAQTVQINYTLSNDPYAEIAIHNRGRYIYQDVATYGNRLYIWSLDHCSFSSSYDDAMNVMIGPPGAEAAQEVKRTRVNGHGDALGPVGTVIRTHNGNNREHDLDGQWEHYEGRYFCPEGQDVTRFTFRNVDSLSELSGNNVTNIVFAIAYPVRYDANGGDGSRLPDPVANDYSGYRYAGTRFSCTDIVPTRDGYAFVGWSEIRHDPVSSADDLASIDFVGDTLTQPADDYVLYAVWAPMISVTVHKVWSGGSAVRPESVTVTLIGSDGSRRSAELNDGNGWTATWTELATVIADRKYVTYTLEEVAVDGFTVSVSGDASSGFTVTNIYVIPKRDVDVDVRFEGRFAEKYLPERKVAHLVGSDGSDREIVLTEGGSWAGTWIDVPETDGEGRPLTYTARQDDVPFFEWTVSGSFEDGFHLVDICTVGEAELDKDEMHEEWA